MTIAMPMFPLGIKSAANVPHHPFGMERIMNWTRRIWNVLWSSFWFLPSVIVAVCMVFAAVMIEADSMTSARLLEQWPRLFGAGATGAQALMSTIASSMMSVVGVTFSVVLVALALASSQYTSRILRTFINSRTIQAILGIFAGIFVYCLIVIRAIRSGDEGAFVPNIAVFMGVVLAIGSVGVLIFFIHHIASSIQASAIISSVATETISAIDKLFPQQLGREPGEDVDDPMQQTPPERKWRAVSVRESGYIQSVDCEALLQVARELRTIVRMEHAIGEFAVEETALVSVALAGPPNRETVTALQAAFSIYCYRTVEQDAAFGIRQLVDVALKALSPGVNDVSTAVTCVDYLTAILSRLANRKIPSPHRYDDGELRVIAKGPSFEGLLTEACDQIRSSASGNVAIISRMLGALQTIGSRTTHPGRRRALREQLELIAELAGRTVESSHDRAKIDERLAQVRSALKTVPVLEPALEPI